MFKSIRIKNFLSLVDAEIPLENLGLVLIDGENHCNFGADSNGSGKSSIFEAILWVLYEETVRGFSKDEVIRHGSTGCFVELWFGEYSFLRAFKIRIFCNKRFLTFHDNCSFRCISFY